MDRDLHATALIDVQLRQGLIIFTGIIIYHFQRCIHGLTQINMHGNHDSICLESIQTIPKPITRKQGSLEFTVFPSNMFRKKGIALP